ncbi:HesA/MoeB/ThiF family protein [Flavihumibacter sp. ZG627]|uniref:HesA/MoeB/ThiF family protein n=1 Tax=Flavihumibacter sp. ZG627 TaxID=1463156 RepID=UPI00057FC609|nr:HesA/MoeB/ThiF family protein [Flavihumibacter sp. ZG627]KIC92087.1 thiamine biosynthesis protein ThiF [Flavihumibacter sp. ZG627]
MKFSFDEISRYSRQLIQDDVGVDGQYRLKAARVLVIGAGGLGSPSLLYLAGAGVGTIGIVDFDEVEIHNLHRQVLFNTSDIGKKKAIIAAEKLSALNPNIKCLVFDEQLNEINAALIISQFDLVLDGSDNFHTRYIVNDTCVLHSVPLVYGSILNFQGQMALFNYNGGKNLRHLYPEAPDAKDVPACGENGVLGIVPGMLGTMMCHLALKVILKHEVEMNSLLLADFKKCSFQRISF